MHALNTAGKACLKTFEASSFIDLKYLNNGILVEQLTQRSSFSTTVIIMRTQASGLILKVS